MTRILHTADWHLGARLVEQDRGPEHALFLDWLCGQLRDLKPDLLLVAGDIFDSANPPQQSLRLYYDFLAQVSANTFTRVLILGGNHDSALTLQAPRELLKALRIEVFGTTPEDPASAILEFDDALICAVPYLRERDVRRAVAAETSEQVAAQIREGIAALYRRLLDLAKARAEGRALIATGHLTAAGSVRSESEREIHVGSLGAVDVQCFEGFDYVALGHLHHGQWAGGKANACYSGSPIPLGFDESETEKQVLIVDVNGGRNVEVTPVQVPCFRSLHRVECDLEEVRTVLTALPGAGGRLPGWVEITVRNGASADLDERVRDAAAGLPLVLLKIAVAQRPQTVIAANDPFGGRALEEILPLEVFTERLRRSHVDPDSQEGRGLSATFLELLSKMTDANVGGEEILRPAEVESLVLEALPI